MLHELFRWWWEGMVQNPSSSAFDHVGRGTEQNFCGRAALELNPLVSTSFVMEDLSKVGMFGGVVWI